MLSVLPGLLDLASPIAANAIFAMTAMAFDLSYIVPIFLYALLVFIAAGILTDLVVGG